MEFGRIYNFYSEKAYDFPFVLFAYPKPMPSGMRVSVQTKPWGDSACSFSARSLPKRCGPPGKALDYKCALRGSVF